MLDAFFPGKPCFDLHWFFTTVGSKILCLTHISSLLEGAGLHTRELDVPLRLHFYAQCLRETFHPPFRRVIHAVHWKAVLPARSAIDTLYTASVNPTHPI